MRKRRVVITGLGVIAPNGIGKDDFWQSIENGCSSVDFVTKFNASDLPTKIAAEVKNFDPSKYMNYKQVRRLDLGTQFAVASAKLAVDDAKLQINDKNRERTGVCDGTSLGGAEWALEIHKNFLEGSKKINPLLPVYGFPGACAGQVALEFGIKGPCLTLCTGSASSANAIIYGVDSILHDESDIMIAGGTEAPLHKLMFGSLCSLKVMSTRNTPPFKACKPFDRNRDGFVVGEGGAFLILEELQHANERDAHIYAEVIGTGISCDAFHMSAPESSGEQIARATKLALEKAEIVPEAVDYINAHGTATTFNDVVETRAIKNVFGNHAYNLMISSTKPITGHLFGAAGAIELVVTSLAIKKSIVPATINLNDPDPDCDLNYVSNKNVKMNIDVALSYSYGFGGKNACIIIRKIK